MVELVYPKCKFDLVLNKPKKIKIEFGLNRSNHGQSPIRTRPEPVIGLTSRLPIDLVKRVEIVTGP